MSTNPHELELEDIFNRLPKAYIGSSIKEDMRVINYSLLKSIVSQMMDKAYYHGQISAVEDVEKIIHTTFIK